LNSEWCHMANPLTHWLCTSTLNSYTRCAWAGGTFFPVVRLCQFFGFWREIDFGVTYLRI
jgi:hypothetical protein